MRSKPLDLETLATGAFAPALDAPIDAIAFGIVTRDGTRATRYAGTARPELWFDLASLTKPLVTAREILVRAADGALDLDAPLSVLIPDLRQYDIAHAWERRLTPRALLAHDTPLPPVVPIYTYGTDPRTLRAWVLQHEWPRRDTVAYSDINYILLGLALERLTGRPFADLPTPDGIALAGPRGPCALTEYCHWRERMLCGEVHDENAAALGGAAGHAGAFGTLDGVLDAAGAILTGEFAPARAIAWMREIVRPGRTLGWEAPSPGWSGSELCSPATIGHLGFTGTGLWVDFDRGLAWTLLTNRVHPTRHRETGIALLRRAISAEICRATGT